MALLILFFMAKSGSSFILSISDKERKTQAALYELQNNISLIKTSTDSLNKDISSSSASLESIKEASNTMTATVQHVTNGVVEQSKSISDITDLMNKADNYISASREAAKSMNNISSKASQIVINTAEKIEKMDMQMNIISNSSVQSLATVQELQQNMDEVNNFLSGITQIADQTNLLALNAAIEAARAGESGSKKFSAKIKVNCTLKDTVYPCIFILDFKYLYMLSW